MNPRPLAAPGSPPPPRKAATPYQQLICQPQPSHRHDQPSTSSSRSIGTATSANAPEFATDLGYPGLDDRWTDMSEAASPRARAKPSGPSTSSRRSTAAAYLPRTNSIMTYSAATRSLPSRRRGFHGDYLAISQLGGVQQTIPQVIDPDAPWHRQAVREHPCPAARRRRRSSTRTSSCCERGMPLGVTEPKIVLQRRSRSSPEGHHRTIPMASSLLKPFTDFPATMPQADRDRLKAEADRSLSRQALVPAYHRSMISWSRSISRMHATPSPGAPSRTGNAWYRLDVREHTTTDMTPDGNPRARTGRGQAHRAEMEQDAATSGFKGDFNAFKNFLRTDPQILLQGPR